MEVNNRTVLFLAALTLPISKFASAQEGRMLNRLGELPPLEISQKSFSGNIEDESFYIDFHEDRDASRINIETKLDGISLGSVILDEAALPLLDYGSIMVNGSATTNRSVIIVEIKFGEIRDCFVNDDGRSRLSVRYEINKAPIARVETFENCKIETREL